MHLKNLKKHFKRLQKYQYGNDYLFNEHNEEDYFSNNDIQEITKLLSECRSNLSREEIKRIRKNLSIDEYFDIIRLYLRDMIDNHKARGEWKIQLTMRIIFVSFTDANETRGMHTKSDNITIMIGIETEDVINELFNTFCKRYQEGLETKNEGKQLYI